MPQPGVWPRRFLPRGYEGQPIQGYFVRVLIVRGDDIRGWRLRCVAGRLEAALNPAGQGPARDDPAWGTEKVSGLNGTAAWGARIYGDGRRTGDSPDRFGRVMLADSTGEQHASRMKGVGRFP